MFTWICPKCGKEVPPSYSECPNCTAKEQPAASAPAIPQAPAPEAPRPAAAVHGPVAAGSHFHIPAWLVTILFAIGFAAALGGGYWAYRTLKDKPVQPTAAATTPLQAPEAPGPVVQTDPAFRSIELTGLRLIEDSKKKTMLQFVVVNHSPADLGDITASVNLKAVAGKQGQEPVGTFSFKTSLGPYESKDLKVPVETKLRVYELPDWQFLRAEIAGK